MQDKQDTRGRLTWVSQWRLCPVIPAKAGIQAFRGRSQIDFDPDSYEGGNPYSILAEERQMASAGLLHALQPMLLPVEEVIGQDVQCLDERVCIGT